MKFKINYHWELSYDDFIFEYLTEVYNNDLSKAIRIESRDQPHLERLIQAYEIINGNLDKEEDDYIRFFKPLVILENKKTELNLAGILITLIKENGERHLLDNLESLWQEEFETLDDMSFYMQNNNEIDVEFKFNLTFALQHSKALYKQYKEYVSQFDIYKEEIEQLVDPILDNLKERVDDQYVHDLFDYLSMDIEIMDVLEIYPTFVLSTGLHVWANQKAIKSGEGVLVKWGCFVYDKLDIKANDEHREERFIEIAKILSDQTKLDIVKYCLDEERYGSQIAKHIGISGATVSHHMSILTSNNYVSVRLDKKRVYYRTNKMKILDHISYISDIFNKDS